MYLVVRATSLLSGCRLVAPMQVEPVSQRRPKAFRLERTFTHRLHTLSKLTDRATQAAYHAEVGMPLGEARCLAAIGSFRPLSVNELALRANLTKAQASRAAQSLVDQGLVIKQQSPVDGRGVTLNLTATGEERWSSVTKVIAQRNEQVLLCLTPEERTRLNDILDRLILQARGVAEGLGESD